MVRIYQPEREDGLVSWVVPGKRRPTRTIRLDVSPGSTTPHARTRVAKREPTSGTDAAGTVRRRGRAGEQREGRVHDAPVEPAATEPEPA